MSTTFVEAVEAALPGEVSWQRTAFPGFGGKGTEHYFTATSPFRARELEIRVYSAPAGGPASHDVEVALILEAGRYEQVFAPPPDASPSEVASEVGEFVRDILLERITLVMIKGLFFGGREFFTAEELQRVPSRRIAWTASWSGTFDRGLEHAKYSGPRP